MNKTCVWHIEYVVDKCSTWIINQPTGLNKLGHAHANNINFATAVVCHCFFQRVVYKERGFTNEKERGAGYTPGFIYTRDK